MTSANLNWPAPVKLVPLSVTRPWYVNTVFWASAVESFELMVKSVDTANAASRYGGLIFIVALGFYRLETSGGENESEEEIKGIAGSKPARTPCRQLNSFENVRTTKSRFSRGD